MKSNGKSDVKKQIALSKKGERKLLQDLHRPMVIEDKKKQRNKYACRKHVSE